MLGNSNIPSWSLISYLPTGVGLYVQSLLDPDCQIPPSDSFHIQVFPHILLINLMASTLQSAVASIELNKCMSRMFVHLVVFIFLSYCSS